MVYVFFYGRSKVKGLSCNKSDRHDLQILQNDALRTCFNVKRRDKLSIATMHKRAKFRTKENFSAFAFDVYSQRKC